MGIKIYRMTDRVTIKIKDLVFKISPLTSDQKRDILSENVRYKSGEQQEDKKGATFKAVKYCVKEVEGIEYFDGSQYELDFDESGNLSDQCVDELLNMPLNNELAYSCFSMVSGIPDKVLDLEGKEVEGVEIIKPKSEKKRKTKRMDMD